MNSAAIGIFALPLPLGLAAQAPLEVRTTDMAVAAGVAQAFSAEPTLEIPEGGHLLLLLDDGGSLVTEAGEGEAPWMELTARPADLMQVFGTEVGQAQQQAQMIGGMLGAQLGLGMSDMRSLMDAAFGFPNQLDEFQVVLPTNPKDDTSFTVDVSLRPMQGTWFAGLVDALAPNPKGVLRQTGDDKMMAISMSLDYAKLRPSMKPIEDMLGQMYTNAAEDKDSFGALMESYWSSTDGTLSNNMSAPGGSGMIAVAGLADPAAYQKLLADDAMRTLMQGQSMMAGADTEYEAKSFSHRDIDVAKFTLFVDNPQMAMGLNMSGAASNGEMITYIAVVGDHLVTASSGAGVGDMKGAIDQVLGQGDERGELPDGALMTMRMNMGDLMDFAGQMGGMPMGGGGDIPETMSGVLSKSDGALHFKIRTQ